MTKGDRRLAGMAGEEVRGSCVDSHYDGAPRVAHAGAGQRSSAKQEQEEQHNKLVEASSRPAANTNSCRMRALRRHAGRMEQAPGVSHYSQQPAEHGHSAGQRVTQVCDALGLAGLAYVVREAAATRRAQHCSTCNARGLYIPGCGRAGGRDREIISQYR